MQIFYQFRLAVAAMLGCVFFASLSMPSRANSDAASPDDSPPWRAPAAQQVESAILEWLVASSPTDQEAANRQSAARPLLDLLYEDGDRLQIVVESVVIALPKAASVAADDFASLDSTSLEWLDSANIPYWIRHNVRLYVGRALVQRQRYDLAIQVLEGIAPTDVFDPASLLFYRSIAEHQLVRIDQAKASLALLLDAEQELPERYNQVARLMRSDIEKVEQDSLDHIARRMSDVERRLSLGEADKQAQEVEYDILASLDKLIDKLEKQKQQQQQQAGGAPSGTPMEDSKIAEQKGEGKVEVKQLGDTAGWGDLPPRERERVMQQIGRDFPGHYRDLMEEYVKRLATDEREPSQP